MEQVEIKQEVTAAFEGNPNAELSVEFTKTDQTALETGTQETAEENRDTDDLKQDIDNLQLGDGDVVHKPDEKCENLDTVSGEAVLAEAEDDSRTKELSTTRNRLSDYRILNVLGKGGQGAVLHVEEKITQKQFALKRSASKNTFEEKAVKREVEVLVAIEHKNIVRYEKSWEEDSTKENEKEFVNNLLESFPCHSVLLQITSSDNADDDSEYAISDNQNDSNTNSADESGSRDSNRNTCGTSESSGGVQFAETATPDTTSAAMPKLSFLKSVFEGYSKRNDGSGFNTDEGESASQNLASGPGLVMDVMPENSKSGVAAAGAQQSVGGGSRSDPANNSDKPVKVTYILMELCDKSTLKEYISEKEGPIDNNQKRVNVLAIFQQIVQAIIRVHECGYMHRDIKPQNIFFTVNTKNVKLGDFGLARRISLDEGEEACTREVGTKQYMSPEQKGKRKYYNEKCDVYPLGVLLFELLHPKVEFTQEKQTLYEGLREGNFPEEFKNAFDSECDLIANMMAQNPDDRPSAAEVSEKVTSLIAKLK